VSQDYGRGDIVTNLSQQVNLLTIILINYIDIAIVVVEDKHDDSVNIEKQASPVSFIIN